MAQPTPPVTFTDRMRRLTAAPLNATAARLHQWGVHPDVLTILGLVLVLIASAFIAAGYLAVGGWLLIAGLPLDALDGAVARHMQRKGRFGAVLDSTLDRFADGFIFAALSYYFALNGRPDMILWAQAALIGSYGVSYVRARADEVDVSVKVNIGFFTRFERLAVIVAMLIIPGILLIPALLEVGVIVLAVGTNITTIQRLYYVYRTLKQRGE
jgi:CDP-diacylglycerol---glycerol-3-phosphate 3-phosphatidyltransferase